MQTAVQAAPAPALDSLPSVRRIVQTPAKFAAGLHIARRWVLFYRESTTGPVMVATGKHMPSMAKRIMRTK
jgi:hypothetical protein